MQLLSWFLSFHFRVFLLVFDTPNSLPLGAPDSSCVGSGALFCNFTSHWFGHRRLWEDTDTYGYPSNNDEHVRTYGGFLKWWVSPTTMGFPTTNWSFWGVKWGYHHLRKHPYIWSFIQWFSGYCYFLDYQFLLKLQLVRDSVWFNLIYLTVEIVEDPKMNLLKLAVLSNA